MSQTSPQTTEKCVQVEVTLAGKGHAYLSLPEPTEGRQEGPTIQTSPQTTEKCVQVEVTLVGRISVLVTMPESVPVGRRRPLAEHVALSRVRVTLDNPDAPDDSACVEYAQAHDLPDSTAESEWDSAMPILAAGLWELDDVE